jgi:hypothetical protein
MDGVKGEVKYFPVLVILFRLTCSGCPVLVIQSASGCRILLPDPDYPACYGFPVLVSCSGHLVKTLML